MRIIISYSDSRQICEESQENDQVDTDGLVEDDHGEREVDLEVQAKRDTVF